MKQATTRFALLSVILLSITIFSQQVNAQCNVNDLYDNIVSGWHQSIAKKSDGSMVVWGNAMMNDGSNHVLNPQVINSTNYPNLNAAIPMKAAIGGQGSSTKSQAILLASDGLYAWGIKDYVVDNTLTSSSTFAKIGTPTGGDPTTKLPLGVSPEDVKMMVAFNQTLVIVTNDGYVWVLTQLSANLQGNGASLANTTWHKVKIDAGTYLTNVIAVRGQVTSATKNALMALTSTGETYVWGNSVYLGDGSSVTSKTYATQMSLPVEFNSSNVPKMIAVTGGGSSTNNTFFVLSKSGSLYALGANNGRQCGDFTTNENKSWVNSKSAAGTNFTNVNFISAMESDQTVPAVAIVTKTGDIYTWGLNTKNMLGRLTDGTTYDPGIPSGFTPGTDKAISVEMGGHTLVYIKEGSTQFCYVGHRVNGSMGDGSTTDATETSFNCSGTPVVETCGSVPIVASATTSTIAVSQSMIAANGTSTSTITIRLKDINGNNLTSSGGVVTVYTSQGTLGVVIDNNDGTYTVILTSDSNPATADITFDINGTPATATTNVVFGSTLPLKWDNLTAVRKYRTVELEWITQQEFNVSYFEIERSINAETWGLVSNKISATNTTNINTYTFIDNNYNPKRLYYRIKEVDIDGRYSYSQIVMVEADLGFNKIIAYPLPVVTHFYLGNMSQDKIKEVCIYNNSGGIVKKWNQSQSLYSIETLQTGVYIIKVDLKDGTSQNIRINKL